MAVINKISVIGMIGTFLSVVIMIAIISSGFTGTLSMDHQNLSILYVFIGWIVPASFFYVLKDLTEE